MPDTKKTRDIQEIYFHFKGYGITAEYYYGDDNHFYLTGVSFDNPTCALMFLAESTGSELDNIEQEAEKAVEHRELDQHEYNKAYDSLKKWRKPA